jgi:WD40 repeat protein
LPGIYDVTLSPNRRWIVTSYKDRPAEIWAFPSGQKVSGLLGGRGGSVSFSPSGRWLGATGDADHLLWNAETWTRGPILPPQVEEKTGYFSFSDDEKYLATSLRDQTALVSLPSGELLALLEQRILPNLYCHLRFSSDGSQLASQGMDNSLILWDLAELQSELHKLNLNW